MRSLPKALLSGIVGGLCNRSSRLPTSRPAASLTRGDAIALDVPVHTVRLAHLSERDANVRGRSVDVDASFSNHRRHARHRRHAGWPYGRFRGAQRSGIVHGGSRLDEDRGRPLRRQVPQPCSGDRRTLGATADLKIEMAILEAGAAYEVARSRGGGFRRPRRPRRRALLVSEGGRVAGLSRDFGHRRPATRP